tara:strand:+ start:16 stop:288 length:273 start_codon:yes stop_codon:yes gene_type:complete
MLGKVFEIANGIQQDIRSATDNKREYEKLQRFYKGELIEKTTVMYYFKDKLKDRLKKVKRVLNSPLRRVKALMDKKDKQTVNYLGGVRKD